MGLNSAIDSGRLQARCLKLSTRKTLEKTMAYEKSTTVTIQKRFLKKRGKEWCDLFVHDTHEQL